MAALATLLLMGDETDAKAKFAHFVTPEIDVLLRLARRLTGREQEAEDLLQDCLLRAYRSIDSFDGEYPRAWLFTILRNTHLNRVRVKKPVLIDDWNLLESASADRNSSQTSTAASSEDEYLNDGLSEAMMQGIKTLGQDFREVLYLVDIEGFSYDETGRLLGIKTATVTSRLNRARTKLRDYLLQNHSFGKKGRSHEHH